MLKRIIVCVIIGVVLLQCSVSASQTTYAYTEEEIINSILPVYDDDEVTTVQRGDCVASIMKLVGVDFETAEVYLNRLYYMPIFDDFDFNRKNGGYIITAYLCHVAYGHIGVCRIIFTPTKKQL